MTELGSRCSFRAHDGGAVSKGAQPVNFAAESPSLMSCPVMFRNVDVKVEKRDDGVAAHLHVQGSGHRTPPAEAR
jgi:hypothetical protein